MDKTFFSIGDDDPYPLRLPFGESERKSGEWELGVAKYRVFQIGPIVEVIATGVLSYFNSEARLVSSPIAVFPPTFGFYVLKPEIGLPAELPFTVKASFISDKRVDSVTIHDREGKHVTPVTQSPG